MEENTKKTFKQKFLDMYNSDKIHLWEWIFFGVVAVLFTLFFVYKDTVSIGAWSLTFWDCLFDGEIWGIYKYLYLNQNGSMHQFCAGNIFYLVLQGILGLPCYIVAKIAGMTSYDNFFVIAYFKLLFLAIFALCAYFSYKLLRKMNLSENDSKWVIYLSVTSLFVMGLLGYFGQNDIVGITFFVLGVYFYLSDKKLNLLFFALAVALKPFFLAMYLALLLLKEKNILKIALSCLIVVSGLVFCSLLYYKAPYYSTSLGDKVSQEYLPALLSSSLNLSYGAMALCVVAFGGLSLFCYLYKYAAENYFQYVNYFLSMSAVMLCLFVEIAPYRPVMLFPFFFAMIMQNKDKFRLNVILELVASVGFWAYLFAGSWVGHFDLRVMDKMLLGQVAGTLDAGKRTFYYAYDFCEKLGLTKLVPIFLGMLFAGLLFIFILNRPRKENMLLSPECGKVDRWIVWLRGLLVLPILAIMCFCYFY